MGAQSSICCNNCNDGNPAGANLSRFVMTEAEYTQAAKTEERISSHHLTASSSGPHTPHVVREAEQREKLQHLAVEQEVNVSRPSEDHIGKSAPSSERPPASVGKTDYHSQARKTGRASLVRRSSTAALNLLHSTNANSPSDYDWIEEPLFALANNTGATLGCKDLSNGKEFSPIFFVIGGCPNFFCGMQAVMYSAAADLEVDFWWVKPGKEAATDQTVGIERETLNRHSKGPHKNDPGRSKPFYKPLADLFSQEGEKDGLRFGIDRIPGPDGTSSPRAFMEEVQTGAKLWLTLVWQEDWTTNPFARSKYIKGKLVYQKTPGAHEFFSRQYSIANSDMTLLDHEDKPFYTVLPSNDIKYLHKDAI